MTNCIHTVAPKGYIQWHVWADKKSQKHYQVKCQHCGLFAIWKRKTQVND